MILDASGRPITSVLPQPDADPRKPATLSRKPGPSEASFAKRLVEGRTQLDTIRVGVWLRLPNGDKARYLIAPSVLHDFAGMIRRAKAKFVACFVESRKEWAPNTYGQWHPDADATGFATADFKRLLPPENVE